MAERYYWLKLQQDFFSSKRIKKMRKLPGGDTLTIIYLKMQLLSLKSDGVLKYSGLEQTFAEELSLDLDEDTESVQLALSYMESVGLIETSDNISFLLPYVVANTGSEGTSAERVRQFRERQKALHCNKGVTQVKQLCNGEIDIEIDKEKDIDKEYINQSIYHSVCDRLTDKQWETLNETYEDFIGLVDLIDERLKLSQEKINDPYAYIISVAKNERWATKKGVKV